MKLKHIISLIILVCFLNSLQAQVIWFQNFEGNAWTPTPYVVGTTGGSATTLTDGVPVGKPSGGQSVYGYSNGGTTGLWHRSDYSTGWSSANDICGGTYQPAAGTCGANGTTHSLIFDGYDAASGSYGLFTYPNALAASTLDLSPYASCGGPVTLTFYYINVDETNLLVSFWNGSSYVTAATLGHTTNAWSLQTVTVPASCLINGTYIQFEAISAFGLYPIGIDEITLTGTPCCTSPATQASSLLFSGVACGGTSITANWTRGNGNDVMVVCRAGSATTGPTSGTAYTANTVYGLGNACGGGFCVYNGVGTSVTVTGLVAGTTYYFDVYEYNTTGTCYDKPSLAGNQIIGNSNDAYGCATALTVGAAATAGTTVGASFEVNESFACNNASSIPGHPVAETVWYKFVASANGHDYVQINQTAGCYANFGATVWDPSIVAQQHLGSYQQTDAYAYCGMISCQQMYDNNAASNPFLFDLCNLTAGNTYYVQVVTGNESVGACGIAGATFNIAVTNGNPGGTVTNPCQQAGISQNYIASSLSTAGASPVAECYINACVTAPGCPSCTTYSLNGATGVNQNNIVWNDYYSFTTANGCSNDLEFQQCVLAQAASPCNIGNVAWLSFQLYTPTGNCITSGDLGTPANIDAYGYLGIPGVGCQEAYVLQYTSEQLNCQYWAYTPFTDNYGSSSCVLPIVLSRFGANENENGNVDLFWTTMTETNNNYFTVARSVDGQTFTNIGKLKATGNSTTMINYGLIDTTASELGQNVLYYRLSQTDFNGNTNDFNIVEVNMNKSFSVSVYPNPSSGDFNLDYNLQQGNFMRVDLADATGTILSSKLYMGSGGLQHQKVQPPQPGMYILNITINGQLIHKKIVKQ